jgi:hypothetical protein
MNHKPKIIFILLIPILIFMILSVHFVLTQTADRRFLTKKRDSDRQRIALVIGNYNLLKGKWSF